MIVSRLVKEQSCRSAGCKADFSGARWLALTGLIAVSMAAPLSSALAQDSWVTRIEKDDWDKIFPGQRMVFGVAPDGTIRAYASAEVATDPGGHKIEDIKLSVLAIEIGGTNTKVCWTSGGQKHCDPPPPQ